MFTIYYNNDRAVYNIYLVGMWKVRWTMFVTYDLKKMRKVSNRMMFMIDQIDTTKIFFYKVRAALTSSFRALFLQGSGSFNLFIPCSFLKKVRAALTSSFRALFLKRFGQL